MKRIFKEHHTNIYGVKALYWRVSSVSVNNSMLQIVFHGYNNSEFIGDPVATYVYDTNETSFLSMLVSDILDRTIGRIEFFSGAEIDEWQ